MPDIALFFHCLFYSGTRKLEAAESIIRQQMFDTQKSGLMEAAREVFIGVNGGIESLPVAESLFPKKATIRYHGLDVFNENATIRMIETWLPSHPDYLVLFFHSKGATHPPNTALRDNWRSCMMRNMVKNWRQCVKDLESGYEAVGCHWMTGEKTPPGQSIFAGNFWWATSNFLRTLPSIMDRARIKESGLGALISRYEAEVWIGNGPRIPKVRDYHPGWIDTCQTLKDVDDYACNQ